MIRILFVCLGNICRSPMAEFLMKQLLVQKGMDALCHIESAGTSGWHNGEDMNSNTAAILDGLGINHSHFVSSQVSVSDLARYDYIVTMDPNNLQQLQKLFGQHSAHMFTITDLMPELGYGDGVPDPWHTQNFYETHYLLHIGCKRLLSHIFTNSPVSSNFTA